jgi:hypothetical protein
MRNDKPLPTPSPERHEFDDLELTRDHTDEPSDPDQALLKEITSRFDYCVEQWDSVRSEAKLDMKYVSGDPWPDLERIERRKLNRPCMVCDELSQYTNQLINDIKQNKRATSVEPKGSGATDKTAELRANVIRQIEYRSNAQYAYSCGFENMCNRSYGYWRILTDYESEESFNQEIRIKAIPNPDTVYPDPDCKERDTSDASFYFVVDSVPKKEYKRKWPEAKITDFTPQHMSEAPAWIKEMTIQVAEYWRVEYDKKKLVEVESDISEHATIVCLSDDPRCKGKKILNERPTRIKKIMQYITNGVEILEKNEWAGKYIPIIPLFGKELWVDDGSGAKRKLHSLIRLARDPQMLYNYYRTTQAELVGMTPKVKAVGYEGQFEGHEAEWQTAHTNPIPYLQVKAILDSTGQTVLPIPVWRSYDPQIEKLEIGAESARRAIQAAMGLSALPTQAQRMNEKSGIALKEINANEDKGSFHFIDNYDMALEYSGRIINDLIPHIYDAEGRTIGARKRDETHHIVRINTKVIDEQTKEEIVNDLTKGDHDITISTGPSFRSEREAASSFLDTILPELEQLPIDPGTKQRLVALAIKLKNLGPIGDQMVDLLSPSQDPAALAQQLAQAQGQLQQAQQQLALLNGENQKLYQEKHGKIIDNIFGLKQTQMELEAKILIAEIGTKSQVDVERRQLYTDMIHKIMDQSHEAGMEALQHENAKELADITAAHAQTAAASQGAGNQGQ